MVALPKILRALLVGIGLLLGTVAMLLVENRWWHEMHGAQWLEFAGFAIIALALITGSLYAIWRPRPAGNGLLVAAALALFCLTVTQSDWRNQVAAAVVTAIVAMLGLFWLLLGRTTACAPKALPSPDKLSASLILGVFSAALLAVLLALQLPKPMYGDCGSRTLPTGPRHPLSAAFTAEVLRVGGFRQYDGQRAWAFARVQRRFWGVHSWFGYVVLHGTIPPEYRRRAFFVDAPRADGFFSRFLPVVRTSVCYGVTPVEKAQDAIAAAEQGLQP